MQLEWGYNELLAEWMILNIFSIKCVPLKVMEVAIDKKGL